MIVHGQLPVADDRTRVAAGRRSSNPRLGHGTTCIYWVRLDGFRSSNLHILGQAGWFQIILSSLPGEAILEESAPALRSRCASCLSRCVARRSSTLPSTSPEV